MSTVQLGDPQGVRRRAGLVAHLAREARSRAADLAHLQPSGWSGPAAQELAGRREDLAGTLSALGDQLDEAGVVLRAYADELERCQDSLVPGSDASEPGTVGVGGDTAHPAASQVGSAAARVVAVLDDVAVPGDWRPPRLWWPEVPLGPRWPRLWWPEVPLGPRWPRLWWPELHSDPPARAKPMSGTG